MQKSAMRILSGMACFYSLGMVATAQADIRVFAAGGLAALTPQKTADNASDKALSGLETKLSGQFDVLSPIPGVAVYAGPDVTFATLTREYTVASVTAKETLKSNGAGLEAGVHLGLIPIVTLQAGLNYSFPLSGDWEVSAGTLKQTFKASSGSQMGATARALITPFPLTRLGLEYSMGSGTAKYNDVPSELKYDFWAARAVFGLSL